MFICFHLLLEKNSNTVEYGFESVKGLFESVVIHLWKNVLRRSVLLYDRVLLDMPYREVLMFNIKFTYV